MGRDQTDARGRRGLDQGDRHRGLEIGLAAWVGLRGARVVPSSHHLLEHLSAAADAVRHGFTRAVDRLRAPATQLAGEGVPERVGAIAGGPAGKVIGGLRGCGRDLRPLGGGRTGIRSAIERRRAEVQA